MGSVYLGGGPQFIAYDSGKGEIFVTNQVKNTTSVINDSTDQVVATIRVGTAPEGVAYDPADGKVFVANSGTDNVSVISDASNTVVATVPVGARPYGVAYDSVTDRVYVANSQSANVSVLLGSSDAVVGTVGVGLLPFGVVYDPGVSHVFVANAGSSNVTVIGGISVLAGTPVGSSPEALAYVPSQASIVVVDTGSNNVTVLSDSTYQVTGNSPPILSSPEGIAVDSGDEGGFVSNFNANNVTVFSILHGGGILANLPVGKAPVGVGYDPAKGEVLVANYESGNVSFIDDGTLPILRGLSASPASLEAGQHTNFTLTNGQVGTNWSRFAYSGLPPGCATLNVTILACRPMAPGTYTVRVYENDSVGHSVSATTVLTVTAKPVGPSITAFSASPGSLESGEWTNFTVATTGGSGTLGYAYTDLPEACPSMDVATLPCQPESTGSFTVRVYVNDSLGNSTSGTTSLTVNAAPLQIEAFGATPAALLVGAWTNLSVEAIGGTGSLSFMYTDLPTGCSTSSVAKLACMPSAAGSFDTRVFVNDTAGDSETSTTTVTVSAPNMLTSVGVSATFNTVGTGQSTVLSAQPVCSEGSCGAGSTYSWTATNDLGSLLPATGASVTFTAGSLPGTDTIFVNVTLGGTTVRSSPFPIVITSSGVPTLSSVAVSPASAAMDAGATQTFAASPTCTATCPAGVVYQWSLAPDLGSLNVTSGSVVLFTAGSSAGSATLFVNATLGSVTKGTSLKISIAASSPGTGGPGGGSGTTLGLSPPELYALLAALGAVAAVVILLVVSRRRKEMTLHRLSAGGAPPPPAVPPTPAAPLPPPSRAPSAAPPLAASTTAVAPVAAAPAVVPAPRPAPPTPTTSPSPAASAPPPRGPTTWPLTPLTTAAGKDPKRVYALAASSGIERERLLVISPESVGVLSGTYGLAGADCWRLSRSEGEHYVSPADADRLADILIRHLERSSNRAVVVVGIEKMLDACGLKVVLRFLEVVRETAEANKGTVLVALNTDILKEADLRQLQEGSVVLVLPG